MHSKVFVLICRLLIVSMMLFSFNSARAGMIGTDSAISAGSSQVHRDAVLSTLGRAEVSGQLLALGVDPQLAKERVAAMTDEEVRTLAGKLDSLPAGADGGWGWGLAAVIIIAAIIYYAYGWKK